MRKYSLLRDWLEWEKGFSDYHELIERLKAKGTITPEDLDELLGLFDAYITETAYKDLEQQVRNLEAQVTELKTLIQTISGELEKNIDKKMKDIHRDIEALKEVAGRHHEKIELLEKDIDELWKEFRAYQIVKEYSKARADRLKNQVLQKVLELDNVKPSKIDAMLDILIKEKEAPITRFSDIAKDPRTLDKYVNLLTQTGYVEVLEKNGVLYLRLTEAL